MQRGLPGGPASNGGTAPPADAAPRRPPPRPMPEPMRRQLYTELQRAEAMSKATAERAVPPQPNESKRVTSRRAQIQRQVNMQMQRSLYEQVAAAGFIVPRFDMVRAEGIAKKWTVPAAPSPLPALPTAAAPGVPTP